MALNSYTARPSCVAPWISGDIVCLFLTMVWPDKVGRGMMLMRSSGVHSPMPDVAPIEGNPRPVHSYLPIYDLVSIVGHGRSKLSPLSPPGPCSTVGLVASRLGLTIHSPAAMMNKVGRVGKGSLRHTTDGLSTARSLAIFAVGSKIEGDEEEEVGADDGNTGEGREFLSRALPGIGEPGPVGGGEVSPGCEVDETEINDELEDLKAGNPLLPPNADATRALEVIPVHDHMYCQVQRNRHP